MNSDLALSLTSELIWTAMMVAAPILLLAMVIGLLISIFQVVTQIQEMTLTFVPKLVAVGIGIIIFGPWMLSVVLNFASTLIGNMNMFF